METNKIDINENLDILVKECRIINNKLHFNIAEIIYASKLLCKDSDREVFDILLEFEEKISDIVEDLDDNCDSKK